VEAMIHNHIADFLEVLLIEGKDQRRPVGRAERQGRPAEVRAMHGQIFSIVDPQQQEVKVWEADAGRGARQEVHIFPPVQIEVFNELEKDLEVLQVGNGPKPQPKGKLQPKPKAPEGNADRRDDKRPVAPPLQFQAQHEDIFEVRDPKGEVIKRFTADAVGGPQQQVVVDGTVDTAFVNHLEEEVEVFFELPDKKLQSSGKVPPGQPLQMKTFHGHEFVIKSVKTGNVVKKTKTDASKLGRNEVHVDMMVSAEFTNEMKETLKIVWKKEKDDKSDAEDVMQGELPPSPKQGKDARRHGPVVLHARHGHQFEAQTMDGKVVYKWGADMKNGEKQAINIEKEL